MGVDTWVTEPTTIEGAGWKPDDAGSAAGGWQPDSNDAVEDNFTGEFSAENISKHATNGDVEGPADGGCRHCGDPGHFVRDCPDKPANTGECFRCGQVGHNKSECQNERIEREFTGECHSCHQVGHRSNACPERGTIACKICKEEGHIASECSANRIVTDFAGLKIAEMSVEEAWDMLEKADKEKDLDDIKKAILAYARAYPEITLPELEDVFREAEMNTYLIAKKQEVSDTHVIVNLQGKTDQAYAVSFQFSAKPRRKKFEEGWPATPEENRTRLAEAGLILDRMVQKCSNCHQLGHGSRKCPEEKVEREKPTIKCAVCSEEGHYARDCRQERKSGAKTCKSCGEEGHLSRDCPTKEPEVCRNCLQEGHRAKDCDQERVMKCRNCDSIGHKAFDCPEPKNMDRVQCRNCDLFGHTGRNCTLPTDWPRVECTNCHQKGHTAKRCTAEPEAETGGDGGFGDGAAVSGGRGWDSGAPIESSGGW